MIGCGSSRRAIRRAAFTVLEALEGRRLLSGTPGQLDPTFGNGGVVTTTFTGPSNDSTSAVIIDSTGDIVVAGDSSNGATIVRYSAPGQRDAGFGTNGAAFIDP